MTRLLLNIDFRDGGNSGGHLLDGWAEQEPTHRWSMGRRSRLRLPAAALAAGHVLVICATPCLHPPLLAAQVVMVSLGDRLLATVQMTELHVMALRLPPGPVMPDDAVLTFTHLSQSIPRPSHQIRRRQRLALMVHSVRIFALAPESGRRAAIDPNGLSPAALATQFESIGQGCQFGLVQRHYGAEPVGLLRFVDTTTAALYEALAAGFSGIDASARLELGPTDEPRPTYRWHQKDYDLRFDTACFVDQTDRAALFAQQITRLTFLRRKFLEDVAVAEKIFVLTRSDCLTEPEALAVYCALTLHGPCTLLWTTYGDPTHAGEVLPVAPGFLRAELGDVDEDRYGSFEVWLEIMKKTIILMACCPG